MITNTAVSTVPQLTLKEAVVNEVNELKANGKVSIHDVTLAVRAAVNSGEIALPGLEAQPNQSNIKYWVNNDDVKRVIETLEDDGTLANMGLINVDYSGLYRVYEFIAASSTPVEVDSTEADPAIVTTSDNPTVSPLQERIKNYMAKVDSATIKQIQSAIKVNGVTCKNLATIVANMGYVVRPGTIDCFSTYRVS